MEKFQGKVKWYDKAKGFGFIVPAHGGADVFVHRTALDAARIEILSEGQRIEYGIEQPKNPEGKVKACGLKIL